MNQLTEYYNTEDKIKELTRKMSGLVSMGNDDPEAIHHMADELMMETLTVLGYTELADMYSKIEKWYS